MRLNSDRVTPEQIAAAREAAIARGADRQQLEAAHAELVAFYGSEAKLAAALTRQALMRALQQQIYGQPRQAAPSDDDRALARELIRRYPDLAAEILGDT